MKLFAIVALTFGASCWATSALADDSVVAASVVVNDSDNNLELDAPNIRVDGVDVLQKLADLESQVAAVTGRRSRRAPAAGDPKDRHERREEVYGHATCQTGGGARIFFDQGANVLCVNPPDNGNVIMNGVDVVRELTRLAEEIGTLPTIFSVVIFSVAEFLC